MRCRTWNGRLTKLHTPINLNKNTMNWTFDVLIHQLYLNGKHEKPDERIVYSPVQIKRPHIVMTEHDNIRLNQTTNCVIK